MAEVPKWGMPTLSYHEGVPGHHFQIAIAQELKGLPQFRKLIPFTAYSKAGPLPNGSRKKRAGTRAIRSVTSGRLQAEMFRAVRLVVDTGIHANAGPANKPSPTCSKRPAWAKRRSPPKSSATSWPRTGMRIQGWNAEDPGAAAARQQELGEKFDQREFHDTVLKDGALPLEILEQQVNN